MGKVDKNTLKRWFKRGAKPNEDQFESLIDSMIHKDEGIALEQMPELIEALDEKAPAEHGHGNYLDKTNPNLEEGEAEALKKALNIQEGAEVIDEIVPEEVDKAVNSQAVYDYSAQKIGTIYELRNTIGKENGQIVMLLGYYESGDKETLPYKWYNGVVAEDNGGKYITNEVGTWIAQFPSDIIDVAHYGASLSYSDNSLIINKCLLAHKVVTYSQNYRISGVINVNTGNVFFSSNKTKLISSIGSTNPVVNIIGATDFEIKDLEFDLPAGGYFLNIDNCSFFRILNVKMNGFTIFNPETKTYSAGCMRGIYITNSFNFDIINNTIERCRGNWGIAVQYCSNGFIYRNKTGYTNRAGITVQRGCKNIKVMNNDCYHNQQYFQHDGAIDMYGYAPFCEDVEVAFNTISYTGVGGGGESSARNSGMRFKDFKGLSVHDNIINVDYPLWASILLQSRELDTAEINRDAKIYNNTVNIKNTLDYLVRITLQTINSDKITLIPENIDVSNNVFNLLGNHSIGTFEIRDRISKLKLNDNIFNLPYNANATSVIYMFHSSYSEKSDRVNIEIRGNKGDIRNRNLFSLSGCSLFNIKDNNMQSSVRLGVVSASKLGNIKDNFVLGSASQIVVNADSESILLDNNSSVQTIL